MLLALGQPLLTRSSSTASQYLRETSNVEDNSIYTSHVLIDESRKPPGNISLKDFDFDDENNDQNEYNDIFEHGHNHNTFFQLPVAVRKFVWKVTVVSVAAGATHCIASTKAGKIWSWGSGASGVLGHGCQEDRICPTQIESFHLHSDTNENAKGVTTGQSFNIGHAAHWSVVSSQDIFGLQCAAGACHSAILTKDSQVFCCGSGTAVGLGFVDTIFSRFSEVTFGTKLKGKNQKEIISIIAGHHHNIVTQRDSEQMWVWGAGQDGRLGTGDSFDQPLPCKISVHISDQTLMVQGNTNHLSVYIFVKYRFVLKFPCHFLLCITLSQPKEIRYIYVETLLFIYARLFSCLYFSVHILQYEIRTVFDSFDCLFASVYVLIAQPDPGKRSRIDASGTATGKSGYDVMQVCVGYSHSVVRTRNGHVYTWGNGRQGSLGHGNFLHKNIPQRVEFFCKTQFCTISRRSSHECCKVKSKEKNKAGNDDGCAVFIAAGAFLSIVAVKSKSKIFLNRAKQGTSECNDHYCGPLCNCEFYYFGKCVVETSKVQNWVCATPKWPMVSSPHLLHLPQNLHISSIGCSVSHVLVAARYCPHYFKKLMLNNFDIIDGDKLELSNVSVKSNDQPSYTDSHFRQNVRNYEDEVSPTLLLILGQIQGDNNQAVVSASPFVREASSMRTDIQSKRINSSLSPKLINKRRLRALFFRYVRFQV